MIFSQNCSRRAVFVSQHRKHKAFSHAYMHRCYDIFMYLSPLLVARRRCREHLKFAPEFPIGIPARIFFRTFPVTVDEKVWRKKKWRNKRWRKNKEWERKDEGEESRITECRCQNLIVHCALCIVHHASCIMHRASCIENCASSITCK